MAGPATSRSEGYGEDGQPAASRGTEGNPSAGETGLRGKGNPLRWEKKPVKVGKKPVKVGKKTSNP